MNTGQSVTIPPGLEARVFAIQRPSRQLLVYFSICCIPLLLLPPLCLIVWVVNFFRYHTMRYRFDREGISMRWGILFRREVILNYARIQDIHLVSNVVERWLQLARVQVQTASGSSTPELTIEGLHEFEAIRDYLYLRMRGTHDHRVHPAVAASSASTPATVSPMQPEAAVPGSAPAIPGIAAAELAGALREIAAELRAIREALPPR